MKPTGATLKVDDKTVTLTDDKYVAQVEFGKDVKLKSELDGHTPFDEVVNIKSNPESNKVAIDLKKAKVRKFLPRFFSFFPSLNLLSYYSFSWK